MKKWISVVTLSLVPLFFLPVTQDFYDTNKWILLIVAAAITMIFSGISLMRSKIFHLTWSPGTMIFGSLALAGTLSVLFASTNKIEALAQPLGPVTFFALAILSTQSLPKQWVKLGLFGATGLVNLIAMYQFFGMGVVMFPGLSYLQNALWTPAGTTMTFLAVSLSTLAILVPDIRHLFKKSTAQTMLSLAILLLLVIIAGTSLTIWQYIPKAIGTSMPWSAAWNVSATVLSKPATAVFGVGPENFVTAYTSGKPSRIITTPLWNVRFGSASTAFFHIATVSGLVGFFFLLIAAYVIIRHTKSPWAILLLLFPPTISVWATLAILILASSEPWVYKLSIKRYLGLLVGIILIVFSLTSVYFSTRFYAGELAFFQALVAAEKNEGTPAYNSLVHAIEINRFMSRYHITMSQITLSLASSVAAEKTPDRTLVGKLVEQGIAEGKLAVTLSPTSIAAWENLGNVYQAVMPVATGADTWALASYQKALSFDPNNPVLLINLGEILVHQQHYSDAITIFTRITALKPDFANAYYNLANVYKITGDRTKEKSALLHTLNLVPQGGSDYVSAKNQLDALSQ